MNSITDESLFKSKIKHATKELPLIIDKLKKPTIVY